jgi:hypothetical protein
MAKKRRERPRRGEKGEARARRLRRFTVGCGVLTAVAFVVLVGSQLLRLGDRNHAHPPAPHGGQVVVLGRGDAHYHAELVVEPTGAARLYPLGKDLSDPVAVEPQLLVAKARPAGGEEHEFVFRPDPGALDADGRATAFLGRLPGEAVAARVTVRVAGFRVRGESFDFEVGWDAGRSEEEVRAAYEADQRRIYLTAGGKYTEADIAASERTTAAAKYRGHRAAHGEAARRGERVCPITGFRSVAALVWRVAGEDYLFCCQPCMDEFVTLAKDRPGEVRRPGDYVKRQ